jgi:hypothetical protein
VLSGSAAAAAPAGEATVEPRAPEPGLDAAAILERASDAVELGGSRSAAFTLEVHAEAWQAERSGTIYKEIGRDGRNTLIVIDGPEQLRGLKVLSRHPVFGPAQQWLYVPSTHRARRVAVGESGRSIFGGDFSASDLEQRRPGLTATLLRRERRDGHDVYVVDVRGMQDEDPVDETLWIRTEDFRLVRREFRVDGRLHRLYRVDALEEVAGIATPVAMTLVNVAGGTRSRVRLHDVRYRVRFDSALFAAQHLDSRIALVRDGPGASPDRAANPRAGQAPP